MAAYISKKTSWLRCVVSFLPAAGTAALFLVLLAGPRLGPLYDFLLSLRQSPPVSRKLLIIDSSLPGRELGDDILDPGAASSLFYTMAEFGAETLIIQVPILGLPAGGTGTEDEILYHFDEEFSLLSGNIRNLFDAIRTGSVAPGDAARYVEELVELSDRGKERLVSALVSRDQAGIDSMEKAAAFFGHVRRPGDLRVQLIRAGEGGRPGILAERDEYSRARPDRDGVLRRIAPALPPLFFGEIPGSALGQAGVLTEEPLPAAGDRPLEEIPNGAPGEQKLEHIIYGALKPKYIILAVEYTNSGPVLTVLNGPGESGKTIPLDRNGAVLFEFPHGGEDFRRIGISDFLAYDEADRDLRRLLSESEALGIYQGIEGENQPGILYDYALSLREEIAASPGSGDDEKKLAWLEARQRYFESLDDFLYGPAEMNLVEGYEKIIASEFEDTDSRGAESGDINAPEKTGIAKMTEMRDSLIQTFVLLRNRYNEVLELREKLKAALDDSFCILGRGSPVLSPETQTAGLKASILQDFPRSIFRAVRPVLYRANPTDTEASALLANSILTGRAIKPGEDKYLFLASLFLAFLTCFFVKSKSPGFTLVIGLLVTVLAGTGFSLCFIFSGVWFDPRVPAAACAAGVLVSAVWALIVAVRYSRRFRLAFGPFVSRPCLKSVIRAGSPLPSQTVTVRAAVAAIKNSTPGPGAGETTTGEYSRALVHLALAFQETASELVKKAGGTVIETQSDMVLACFGSPLERVFTRNKKKAFRYKDNNNTAAPEQRAVDFVSETARRPEYASWRFCLDMGDCTFAWTALSGYFALGVPVRRARLLSRLADRYRAQIVVSSSINKALPELALKKLGTIKEDDGSAGEAFFALSR